MSGAAFLVDAAGQWLADEEWAGLDPGPPDQEELRREAGWGATELGGHVAEFARAMPGRGSAPPAAAWRRPASGWSSTRSASS